MVGTSGFRWTVALGCWWGTRVEVHVLLLLGLAAVFALSAHQFAIGLIVAVVWVTSVVLHQLAHVLVALRLGSEVERVVVGPAGGTYKADLPNEPEPQVLVALFGPAVHLFLVVVAMCPLVLQRASEVLSLLHPIAAVGELTPAAPLGLTVVKTVLWANWILFLVNLLPAYPFDAAIVLRSLLWPMVGRRTGADYHGPAGPSVGRRLPVLWTLLGHDGSNQRLRVVHPDCRCPLPVCGSPTRLALARPDGR